MTRGTPFSRGEIIGELAAAQHEVAEFFGALGDGALLHRVDGAWSPAEHLWHLNASVGAVARGVGLPRLLLLLRFGWSRRPSMSFAELRDTYRAKLAAGGRASGAYLPPSFQGSAAEQRTRLLARWTLVNERLRTAVGAWSELPLDRLRLPHPLLGMLTSREMLFFTIYHNRHHIAAARSRLPAS